MDISKAQVVQLLEANGEDDKAARAEAALPEEVDTERDAELLDRLGIDPQRLMDDLLGGVAGGFG